MYRLFLHESLFGCYDSLKVAYEVAFYLHSTCTVVHHVRLYDFHSFKDTLKFESVCSVPSTVPLLVDLDSSCSPCVFNNK